MPFFVSKSTSLDYTLAPERIDVLKNDVTKNDVTFTEKSTMTVKESIEKAFRKYPKSQKAWTESPDPVVELSNFSTGFYFEK